MLDNYGVFTATLYVLNRYLLPGLSLRYSQISMASGNSRRAIRRSINTGRDRFDSLSLYIANLSLLRQFSSNIMKLYKSQKKIYLIHWQAYSILIGQDFFLLIKIIVPLVSVINHTKYAEMQVLHKILLITGKNLRLNLQNIHPCAAVSGIPIL